MHETPFVLLFEPQPRLSVDKFLGVPHVGKTADNEEFAQNLRSNLQIAFELARINFTRSAGKQAELKSKVKPYLLFKPGEDVLVYRTYQDSDGPNPKLLLTVCLLLTVIISGSPSTAHERHPRGSSPPCPYEALPSTRDTTCTSL